MKKWSVYMVRCRLGRLYTGITTDVERRFQEHVEGKKGARNLRGKAPLELVFSALVGDRSEASRVEAAIKKMKRRDKEQLVRGNCSLSRLLPQREPVHVDEEQACSKQGSEV